MKKIAAIIGARPQFIKHYPLELAARNKTNMITIHTGQHYDENMSKVFFDQLGMDRPGYMLKHGGGHHGAQTGRMMMEIEEILLLERPDMVVVYGDTNSTLAGALVASKMDLPVAHIEAGLRSYNRSMPEEINRVLTDHISTWLFTPSSLAKENLAKEGILQGVYEIGDIMKDMVNHVNRNSLLRKPDIQEPYYYATLHRPYNVDNEDRMRNILDAFNKLRKKVVFAIHPRSKANLAKFNIETKAHPNIRFIDPQPYFENLGYVAQAECVLTDSGGMQKEAYWMKKKCITIRTETEWLETLAGNANKLVFDDLAHLQAAIDLPVTGWDENLYGDGKSCGSIVDILIHS